MKRSALYVGLVVHKRHRPVAHRFRYRVYSLLLDLDELPFLNRSMRLFGYNKWAVFSLLDRDHGAGDGRTLKQYVSDQLRAAGIDDVDGPVRLLCYPRVFGYVFNPLSVFYCYDKQERLRSVIYEVNNTHGERHSYVIPVAADQERIRHSCDKRFFVSPFMPMGCRYRFQINDPGERLRLFIHETDGETPLLDAWFTGRRKPLSDSSLFKVGLTMPLLTVKVILGIHWEALRLWRKGLPINRHPPTPQYDVSFEGRGPGD